MSTITASACSPALFATESTARTVADHLLQALDEPYVLEAGTVHHSASIGIAVCSGLDADVSRALSDADEAMYEAKHRGKNRAVVFGRGPKVDGTAWGAGPADQKKA